MHFWPTLNNQVPKILVSRHFLEVHKSFNSIHTGMLVSAREIFYNENDVIDCLMVKLKGKLVDKCIIQVYMPTTEHSEEEVDDMYEKREQLLDAETKGKDYTTSITDTNLSQHTGRTGRC